MKKKDKVQATISLSASNRDKLNLLVSLGRSQNKAPLDVYNDMIEYYWKSQEKSVKKHINKAFQD